MQVLILTHVYDRSGHGAAEREGGRQGVAARLRRVQVRQRHVDEPPLSFDQNGASARGECGHTGRATAGKGIEQEIPRSRIDACQLAKEFDRLGGGMTRWISNSRNLEHVLLMFQEVVGVEDVRWPTAVGIRYVDLFTVEIVCVDPPRSAMKGIGSAGLFTIAVVAPGDACSHVKRLHQSWAGSTGDDDRRERRLRLVPSSGSAIGVDPGAETFEFKSSRHKIGREQMTDAIISHYHQSAAGDHHAQGGAPEVNRRPTHVPSHTTK
jgi:hypothetical protein